MTITFKELKTELGYLKNPKIYDGLVVCLGYTENDHYIYRMFEDYTINELPDGTEALILWGEKEIMRKNKS